jgi:hypothetical protein
MDNKKIKEIIEKLADNEIIIMCDKEKCPRYKVIKRQKYEPINVKILLVACPWHTGDTEVTNYLDKDLKGIFI